MKEDLISTLRTLLLSGDTDDQHINGHSFLFYDSELQGRSYWMGINPFHYAVDKQVYKPIDVLSDEEYTEYLLKGGCASLIMTAEKVT